MSEHNNKISKAIKVGSIGLMTTLGLLGVGLYGNHLNPNLARAKNAIHIHFVPTDEYANLKRKSPEQVNNMLNGLNISDALGLKHAGDAQWWNESTFTDNNALGTGNYNWYSHGDPTYHLDNNEYGGSMPFGKLYSGSPRHYSGHTYGYNGDFGLGNGAQYDEWLGHWHSQLEFGDLIRNVHNATHGKINNDFRAVYPNGFKDGTTPTISKNTKNYPPMVVSFIRQAEYYDKNGNKHDLDVVLQVTPVQRYIPWRGNRYISISHNLYDGIYQNGFKKIKVQYEFYDDKTKQLINFGSNQGQVPDAWMQFREVNGLEKYGAYPKPSGTDAWRNDANYVYHDFKNPRTAQTYAHEGIDAPGADNGDRTGEYINGARGDGNEDQVYGYSGDSSKINGREGIQNYWSNTIHHYVVGGNYDTGNYSNNDDSHKMLIHLKGTHPTFYTGTGVGYSSIQPFTNVGKRPHPVRVNLYSCKVGKDKKLHIYHKYGLKSHPRNHMIKKSTFMNTKLSAKKLGIKKSQVHTYLNNKGYFKSKKAMKNWLTLKKCNIIPPKKPNKHHTPGIPVTPTPHYPPVKPTPIHKSVSHIHPINLQGRNGGRLSHPNQNYDYNLNGTLPNLNVHNNEEYHIHWYQDYNKPIYSTYYITNAYGQLVPETYISGYNWSYYRTWHYGYDDYYNINDQLPKEVSVDKTPTLYIGGHTIDGTVSGNTVSYHLNATEIHDYSSDSYRATIPVKANHLPKVTAKGWETYWNGGNGKQINDNTTFANEKIGQGQDTAPQYKHKHEPSNHVPVDIKKVAANIYHYSWNPNKQNQYDQFFPEDEQSFGITNNVNNPSDLNYKNYRYDKYFNDSNVLKHHIHLGYVGSDFGVKMLNRNVKNHKWHYRFIYPSIPVNKFSDYHPIKQGKDGFDSYENQLKDGSMDLRGATSSQGNSLIDGHHDVPVNINPDNGNAYTDTGFDQTNYFPYLVPTVDINIPNHHVNPNTPHNPSNPNSPKHPSGNNGGVVPTGDRSSRLVIDTDSKRHGLPFHLDTMSENDMYDVKEYGRDYNGAMIRLRITDPVTHKTLYKADRPLASKSGKLTTAGEHQLTNNEWPEGNNNWSGYMDRKALQADKYTRDTDLHVKHDTNAKDASNGGFPVKAHFSIASTTDDSNGIRLRAHNIYTHAYTAEHPNINANSFGNKYVENWNGKASSGKATVSADSNPKYQATYILPERTTKYGTNGKVREAKERMDMIQPRKQIAKAGYGLKAGDIKTAYLGHIDASRYSHLGTSLLTAYPKDFNAKGSSISDPDDPYNHIFTDSKQYYKQNFRGTDTDGTEPSDNTMNAAPMVHVHPSFTNNHNSQAENNNLPSYLDNFNDNQDAVDADNYYDNLFRDDGKMISGQATTTYGYTPKNVTENNSYNGQYHNGGQVRVGTRMAQGYYAKDWNDPTIKGKNIFGHNVNTFSDFADSNAKQKDTDSTDNPVMTTPENGQNERLYLQKFLQNGIYPMYFESPFLNNNSHDSRIHRLGGNFIHINEKNPLYVYAHQYITTDDGDNVNDYTNNATPHTYKDHVAGQPTKPLFNPKAFDELSPQPILTNPGNNGNGVLYQVPNSTPAIPKDLWSDKNASNYWLWDTDIPV